MKTKQKLSNKDRVKQDKKQPSFQSKELTAKRRKFVDEYVIDWNATQAAIRAGYSEKTAESQASRMLSIVKVQEYLQSKQKAISEKTEMTAELMLRRLDNVYNKCSEAVPVLDKKGNPTGEYRFDSSGAIKSVELIGKYLGMFKDKLEVKTVHNAPMAVIEGDMSQKEATDTFMQIMRNPPHFVMVKESI